MGGWREIVVDICDDPGHKQDSGDKDSLVVVSAKPINNHNVLKFSSLTKGLQEFYL